MLLLFILKIILTKTTKDSLDEQDIHYNNVNLQNHPKQKQINLTGACGPSLTYLIEGEKLIIEGIGNMTNYNSNFLPPWNSIRDEIKVVQLSEFITSIGSYAFYYFSSLQTINIPVNVTSIGFFSFYYCTNLQAITIPENVVSIGIGTFYYCSNLTNFVIPPKLLKLMNTYLIVVLI